MTTSFFCLTIRFLQPYSNGRGEDGEPEWPPSPLRAFQSLVAAAAARWNERLRLEYAAPALGWLEKLLPPTIVAAVGVPAGTKYQLAVPNNDLDVVASAWSKRQEPKKQPSELKTLKAVRPMHLRGGDAVHYLYPLRDGDPELEKHRNTLIAAARSITHLGWGVDMVAGNAAVITDEEAGKLSGERWQPAEDASAGGLRVPRDGTLANLADKHTAFLNRLSGDGFTPVPPLSAFRVVGYRRATEPAGRAWVAFELLKPEATGKASFDTARRCRDVAAWVRNLTGEVCRDWDDVATFVHGHDPADNARQLTGDSADDRFMYLPLPTINPKLNRVESIRRVLIAAPARCRDQVEWVRRRLPGQDLIDEQRQVPVGVLNLLPRSDWVLRQYTEPSAVWSTVTPVLLPGYDDPRHYRRRLRDNEDAEVQRRLLGQLHQRVEGLLRTALCQAGFAPELADSPDLKLEWRGVGFRAGVDLAGQRLSDSAAKLGKGVGFRAGVDRAGRYEVPESLGRWPRVHVRVRFPVRVPGPVVIGAGRYRGFGVFASETGS